MRTPSRGMLWDTRESCDKKPPIVNIRRSLPNAWYKIRHTGYGAAGQTGQWKLTRSRSGHNFWCTLSAQAVTWFLVRALSAHTTMFIAIKTNCSCFAISKDDSTSSHTSGFAFTARGCQEQPRIPDLESGNPKMSHPNQLQKKKHESRKPSCWCQNMYKLVWSSANLLSISSAA